MVLVLVLTLVLLLSLSLSMVLALVLVLSLLLSLLLSLILALTPVLVLVLQVEPFASLAGAVRGGVPRLLVNRVAVGPFSGRRRPQDLLLLGDLVAGVRALKQKKKSERFQEAEEEEE
ncbi:unnamed protein product [Menidia menidia]|uniref:(Atlantic silverside) hypothetical protein n=1 Tax=Menidia menidia TaxID=238744 RepID=A0A8S4AGJ6_9TELE|nr:unnamed protein product [Menidia menidia]